MVCLAAPLRGIRSSALEERPNELNDWLLWRTATTSPHSQPDFSVVRTVLAEDVRPQAEALEDIDEALEVLDTDEEIRLNKSETADAAEAT